MAPAPGVPLYKLNRSPNYPIRHLGTAATLIVMAVVVQTCKLDELVTPPPGGTLAISPVQLRDSAAVGSTPLRVWSIEVTNTGTGVLSWSASRALGSAWLVLSATSGTAPSTVSVSLNPAGLPVGIHRDTIIVVVTDSPTDPTRVPVQFTIFPCRVTSIALGSVVTDSLVDADCEAPHRTGHPAKLFSFSAAGSDSVTINLRSSAFDAYVIVDSASAGFAVPLAETDDCQGASGDPCLTYLLLPRAGSYIVEATAADEQGRGTFTLEITPPRPPAPPVPQQLVRDSITKVAVGGSLADTLIVFQAQVSYPDTIDIVRLEVEVEVVGVAFDSVATAFSDAVRSDSNALVTVTGLIDDTDYHWLASRLRRQSRDGARFPDRRARAPGPTGFARSAQERSDDTSRYRGNDRRVNRGIRCNGDRRGSW